MACWARHVISNLGPNCFSNKVASTIRCMITLSLSTIAMFTFILPVPLISYVIALLVAPLFLPYPVHSAPHTPVPLTSHSPHTFHYTHPSFPPHRSHTVALYSPRTSHPPLPTPPHQSHSIISPYSPHPTPPHPTPPYPTQKYPHPRATAPPVT